ncbi:tRNA (adenosine(37)-N6)-threonylcarbamoyltransferase complex transferase subunit TsaD [Aliishimia ponticola]|uniref:tRNA N6-adenosine threonylcarbamoyltransferase n=1 Tax=Aliishimia ponticola TaxID=2499833 RepID=A0A4S4N669_9RHOB|nr:tRNA (adenosine(37)-N6)-threonylcarbamoyltransferase complex transferase subunit TsaD [Aliishimia ponticola]THH34616.1 tRNA (adenosine(37)-N6)-threonylcarbamoyltransferase complex transferase subunit TsaD [Aliishimia ponticola]
MTLPQTILAIESSCDDTAAAVVRGVPGAPKAQVSSSIVFGQTELHAAFGGVVPEIAARAHAEKVDLAVAQALDAAQTDLDGIDAIAVTSGPGLIGGVISGVMCAKGLAAATGKPIFGVNHLAGHALTPRLTDGVAYPYLMLLVSGGHCQFLLVEGPTRFRRLGGTIDDAPGEAFDKVARLLGLPQPGGPSVENAAASGDPRRFALPRPLLDRPDCNMSFSGLKTAVLRARDTLIADQGGLYRQDIADLSAGFQDAVADVLAKKSARACEEYLSLAPDTPVLCVAGGVAANQSIRARLEDQSASLGIAFVAPPLALCTDNAAMIGGAALEQMSMRPADGLTLAARPRWPLDDTAPAMLGSGRKGAKA